MRIILMSQKILDKFQTKVIKNIFYSSEHEILSVVIDSKQRNLLKRIKIHILKGRGFYILIMIYNHIFNKLVKKKNTIDAYNFFQNTNIKIFKPKSIYDPIFISKLKSLKADIILLLSGFGIIKKPLLNLFPHGVISYHHGDMSKFRGMPPVFWELYHNENVVCFTIQVLTEGLDSGYEIIKRNIPIYKGENLRTIQRRLFQESTKYMTLALNKLEQGYQLKKLDKYGEIYTLPNLRQWLLMKIRTYIRNNWYKSYSD